MKRVFFKNFYLIVKSLSLLRHLCHFMMILKSSRIVFLRANIYIPSQDLYRKCMFNNVYPERLYLSTDFKSFAAYFATN